MPPRSCDDIKLLISKYVDGEATREECEMVDLHVTVCAECSYKLTEYMGFAAIFAEAPLRAPQPDLRAGVFHEIGSIKEEARRKEAAVPPRRTSRLVPTRGGGPLAAGRLWEAFSPFAAVSLALVALAAVVMVNAPRGEVPSSTEQANIIYPSVPTIPATVVYPSFLGVASNNSAPNVPPAIGTRPASQSPAATAAVILQVPSVAGGDVLLGLQQAAPVMESGSAWHQMRDPVYGYSISYPSNWWTQLQGDTRLFFPWRAGGTKYSPYWVEMRVQSNPQRLDASRANDALLGGKGKLEGAGTATGALWLRYSTGDDTSVSDEIYAFDASNIYVLRLNVPRVSQAGAFPQRWSEAQDLFSKMSRKVSLGAGQGRVLFLNGGDLYSVGVNVSGSASDARPVWRGYGTRWARQFALSPDGRDVAYSTTATDESPWATDLSLGQVDASPAGTPQPLMANAEIHDIAWYSDRDLLALAKTASSGLGIYRITLSAGRPVGIPQLLVKLGDDMSGARGLSVSPDRQLISFLAPVGAYKGTDVYAVRPDGSGLTRLVAHADAVTPGVASATPDHSQAVKSYAWTGSGVAEQVGSYSFDMLYIEGNADSPTLHGGGSLYGVQGGRDGRGGPLLDPAWLRVSDAASVQIMQPTYSPVAGKVAFSGFYNLKDFKVETPAGLWTADVVDGAIANVKPLPLPATPRGVTDLQWSPDGKSLIYRETVPGNEASFASRYDGHSPFALVKLDTVTSEKTMLYDATSR